MIPTQRDRLIDMTITINLVVNHFRSLQAACDAAEKAGTLAIVGRLHRAIWTSFEGMLKLLDPDGWIAWHLYENDCGKKSMKAKGPKHGKPRPVRTARQLARIIMDSEDEWRTKCARRKSLT